MPREPNLHRIGNTWSFRAKVPIDLLDVFGGRKEVKKALGTSDYKRAVLLVAEKRREFK